jgi:hypothetical protein
MDRKPRWDRYPDRNPNLIAQWLLLAIVVGYLVGTVVLIAS